MAELAQTRAENDYLHEAIAAALEQLGYGDGLTLSAGLARARSENDYLREAMVVASQQLSFGAGLTMHVANREAIATLAFGLRRAASATPAATAARPPARPSTRRAA